MNRASSNTLRRAFTITELLVVITLIVILVLIAVPSFSAMIYSSEESLAESQFRAALRAARDAAVRSNGAADGAAVFFFEPGGRLTILPCVKVGEMTDWVDSSAANSGSTDVADLTRREIFAAAPGFSAISLPKYWMVRGFAPVNALLTQTWYESAHPPTNPPPPTGTQANSRDRQWVFPETAFFNIESRNDGYERSTFMVRFRAGTGELVGASTAPALVFAPRSSSADRTTGAFATFRADRAEDPIRFVRQMLANGMPPAGGDSPAVARRRLIGRGSSDMVLARPVMQVALYNENRLADALGVRVDRTTDSLYAPPPLTNGLPVFTNYLPAYIAVTPAITLTRINQFIEGDTNADNTVDADDKPEAKLFGIDRYSGALRRLEVQP
jgi:prepilin-type N-terminal cleavage/methylation domain-containing protein